MLKKIITEPLIHFLLLALLFFIVFDRMNNDENNTNVINISDARIEQLKQRFVSRWKREPQPKELKNAITFYATNQMYLREARALKMDMGDTVIDKRLRQKMDFLIDDLISTKEPSSAELQLFYQSHIENYKTLPLYTFKQVHISTDTTAEALAINIEQQVNLIKQGKAPQGNTNLLPYQLENAHQVKIDRLFGKGFSQQLKSAKLSTWVGPLSSVQGQHFVFIDHKQAAANKPFASVAQQVLKEWQYQNLEQAKAGFEQQLEKTYTVILPAQMAEKDK